MSTAVWWSEPETYAIALYLTPPASVVIIALRGGAVW